MKICTPLITPSRLTPITQSQSFQVMRSMGRNTATPALLQTRCTLPKRSRVACAAPARASRSVTSTLRARHCAFDASNSRRAASKALSSTSAMTTFMPADAHDLAMPRPIPLAPPVMNATLPAT